MSTQKSSWMAAVALIAPVLISAGSGGAYAAASDVEPYLQSAQKLLEKNDLKGAEIQLRNAVQRAPQDGSIRIELARLYMRQGNIAGAEAELIAAKQRGVISDDLTALLAEVMFRRGEHGELLREIPARDRRPSTESVVRTYRGLAELAIGEANEAQNMLGDAERLDPKAIAPKIAMARLLLTKNDPAGADRKIDEALALAPHDSQALDVKGITMFSRGDAQAALGFFNQALKENPQNLQALLDRANIYADRGQLDDAEKDLKSVQRTSPNSAMAAYLEALVDVRRANWRKADAALAKLSSVMERLPESYLLAGMVKYNLNQLEQAEAFLNRYVARRQDKPQAYALLGSLALRQGNADRALAMLNQAATSMPDSPEIKGMLAQAYMAKGDYPKASALFDDAVKAQPDNASLRTQRALNRFTSGETGAAVTELSDVFKSGTTQAGPPLVLAALRAARIDEAAQAAEALIKQDPNDLINQQLLGVVRVAQHNLPEAEKIYRGILEKQQDQPTVRRNLAQVYLAMNRPADAKKLFQDRLAKDAKDASSLQQLAAISLREKDYDGAVQLLRKAAEAVPADSSPRFALIGVYEMQKKWPDAIKEARAVVAAFSGNLQARDLLGRLYYASGDVQNGLATFRDAVRAFPNSAVLYADYGSAAAAAKDFPTAITALNKAIQLNGGNDQYRAMLVEFTYQSKGPDAALELTKSFATANPGNPTGDLLSAEVLERSGKRPEAIALLDKSQSKNPSLPVLLKLVDFHQRNNDLKRATNTVEAWIKDHPGDTAPRLRLAELYSSTRNYAAAQTQYEKLAAERPDDPVVLNNLSWLYARANDPKARKMAEKAYQLAPGAPGIADTLGWILARQGDASNAMKYMQVAIAGMPDSPDVQYHYALVLSQANKPSDARAMLQKALASKSDFESKAEAKQLLDRLAATAK
jgi:putative PEP-CTERM system TPR-repeat lipoprotein